MSNPETAAKTAGRRGHAAAWAAALLVGWLPSQGLCAPAKPVPTPRPPDHAPEASGPATAPSMGNPDSDPDVEVSGTGKGETSEVFLAAHKDVVVVSWVDMRSGTRCGYAASQDGGKTWGPKIITAPVSGGITGDATVGVDDEGNFYLVCQDYGVSQLRISKSTDGAKTWTPWKSFQSSPDKPWVAGVRNGTVYVTWLGSPGGFKRSLDGGETWEAVKSLGNLNHGTAIGTGNTGLVHLLFNAGSPLRYVRSKDWGATLEAGRNIVSNMGASCYGCSPRQHPIVGGGSDPTGKVVVATWSARLDNSDGADDVHVVISRDAGDTWSQPIKVNDNTNNSRQFQPWAAVDGSGKVHVTWTDMRNGKNSTFYAYAGADNKFSKNVEITDQTGNVSGFYGDYKGITINGDDVLVVWADSRAGDVDVYFSRGKGLAAGGIVAVKDAKAEAARIKAAWTTTALFDVKGARVKPTGREDRPAAGKYLPGKAKTSVR
jgi:hypothetical protein